MIRLRSNWGAVDREMDRLSKAPSKAALYLDTVLHKGFALTQAAVHVETGSLKSSGTASTQYSDDKWEGKITYGGVSFGVNNPVTYAIYEKARGKHWAGPSSVKGNHDFLAPMDDMDDLYSKAILRALRR